MLVLQLQISLLRWIMRRSKLRRCSKICWNWNIGSQSTILDRTGPLEHQNLVSGSILATFLSPVLLCGSSLWRSLRIGASLVALNEDLTIIRSRVLLLGFFFFRRQEFHHFVDIGSDQGNRIHYLYGTLPLIIYVDWLIRSSQSEICFDKAHQPWLQAAADFLFSVRAGVFHPFLKL